MRQVSSIEYPSYSSPKTLSIFQEGEKYILFITSTDYKGKTSRTKKGWFLLENNEVRFQFAGKSFRMSNSKKYESSLKLIDTQKGTWTTLNTDRKRTIPTNIPYYIHHLLPEIQRIQLSNILEE